MRWRSRRAPSTCAAPSTRRSTWWPCAPPSAASSLNCQVDLAVPEAVVGDPARLRQVLINLVSNAVKFTPAGDVFVVAEAQDKGDGQVELHFAVKDEGPGIPADQLERLLAAPNEPDDAWTPRRGMGLSICRTLAERMGGRLWADAREGRGSTFHFTAHGRRGARARLRRTCARISRCSTAGRSGSWAAARRRNSC